MGAVGAVGAAGVAEIVGVVNSGWPLAALGRDCQPAEGLKSHELGGL